MVTITRTGRARTFVDLLAQGRVPINLQYQASKLLGPHMTRPDHLRPNPDCLCMLQSVFNPKYMRTHTRGATIHSKTSRVLRPLARQWGRCDRRKGRYERAPFHGTMSPGARRA